MLDAEEDSIIFLVMPRESYLFEIVNLLLGIKQNNASFQMSEPFH